MGGAQAVAALTYGAGFIPKVDKLVGPGNAYVAAAKRMAYGTLDIDMVAGPSEVLVIADETADPKYVAADLLSQAEHDRLASAVLLTTSMELAQAGGRGDRPPDRLSEPESRSWRRPCRDFGRSDCLPQLGAGCAELANEIAPEHLEIVHRKIPRALAALDQECRCGVPGGLGSGAAGRLSGRPGPCAAHLRHGPLLLAAVAWTVSSRP